MLQISPAPEKVLSDSELLNLYPWPNKPWIRANMVQSLDGSVTDQNQNTISLSTNSEFSNFTCLTLSVTGVTEVMQRRKRAKT